MTAMATMLDQPIICPIVVGRDAALDAVGRCLDRVRQGAGSTLLVNGEAGIGKSRLVAEARSRALRLGFAILQGHCFEPDLSLPFAAVIDLLQTLGAELTSAQLAQSLSTSAPALLQLLPEITSRPGNVVPPQAFDREQDRRRLFDSFVAFLRDMSTRSPLLIIVEDLHWSDDASLEGLLHLAHRIAPYPILLMLTYRNDEIQPGLAHLLAELDRRRLGSELRLDRLSAADIDAMVRAIFDVGRPIRFDLLDKISVLTDGNPFFVEETLKSLVAEGEIYFANGEWNRKEMATLRVPRSVQEAVRQRVERISEPAQQAISLAAVAGRRFDFSLLQFLLQIDEEELLGLIKEMIRAQLVIEQSADRFAFRHALTREAIYSSLLARERQALHGRVAEAIERLPGQMPEASVADLALHFSEAGVWDKAFEYARRAGGHAQAMYSPRAAADQLTRALVAAEALGLPRQPELFRTRGQAYETLGEFDRARTDYESALAAARDGGNRSPEWQALLDLGFLWASQDYGRAGDYFSDALTVAREIDDPIKIAQSLNRVGNWRFNTGQPEEACRDHENALAVFRRAEDLQGVADSLDLLAMASGWRGDTAYSAGKYDEAIELFRELGDRRGLVNCLVTSALLAIVHPFMIVINSDTSVDTALARVEEAVTIAREIRWRAGEAFALLDWSYCLYGVGELGRALEALSECLSIAQEIEHKQWEAAARICIGAVLLDMQLVPAATRELEEAVAFAREVGSSYWNQYATLALARANAMQGDFDKAETIITQVLAPDAGMDSWFDRIGWYGRADLELMRGNPIGSLRIVERLLATSINTSETRVIPTLLLIRGKALTALDHPDEAVSVLTQAEAAARERSGKVLLWQILVELGRAEQRRGNRDHAERAFTDAREIAGEIAATLPDEPIQEFGIESAREQFLKAATTHIPTQRPPTKLKAAKRAYDGLTARERDVAALIAAGMSNRAIAEELVVGERTVATHVANILAKLNFSSRSQIAVWAAAKGLGSIENPLA
jgi:tetratricopeptide (TPR) repeat protein